MMKLKTNRPDGGAFYRERERERGERMGGMVLDGTVPSSFVMAVHVADLGWRLRYMVTVSKASGILVYLWVHF